MRKSVQRLIGIGLCMCILAYKLAVPIVIYAKESEVCIEPRMMYISSYTVQLTISDSGVATINGSITGKSGVTHTKVKVTLQQSVSDTWVDVESWEDANDSKRTSVDVTYQVSRGTYRVVMICSANSETKSTTSATKTY